MENKFILPEPSEDFAWFVGVLCSGGYCTGKQTEFGLGVTSKEFRDEFGRVGNKIFELTPHFRFTELSKKNVNHQDQFECWFASKKVCEWLGDFRTWVWADTINQKYKWISDNEKFVWAFLSGFFDGNGTLRKYEKICREVGFAVMPDNGKLLIKEMLSKVDVHCRFSKTEVLVERLFDIQTMAKNMKLVVKHKKERLKVFESLVIEDRLELYNQALKLKKEKGFGSRKVAKILSVNERTVNDWFYRTGPPLKHRYMVRKNNFIVLPQSGNQSIQTHMIGGPRLN